MTVLGIGHAVAAPPPQGSKPIASLLEIRQRGIVMQQWDFSCGAAALATLLTYQHGDRIDEREVAKGMLAGTDPALVQARLGFSLLDLKRFADARGYRGVGYGRMTLDHLVRMGPAIVPLNLRGYNHFVVFERLDGDRVIVADPAFGRRTLSRERFERAWVGPVAFVVQKPAEPIVGAETASD